MVVITGSDTYFTNINSTFTATKWEACIEQAIDKINGYARDDILSQMTGTAGTKTVSLPSAQAGFVRELAVSIYQQTKTGGAQSKSFGLGALQTSESASSSGGSEIEELAKNAALNLKEIDVSFG